MTRKIKRLFIGALALSLFCATAATAVATELKQGEIPLVLKPCAIIRYDENNNPVIVQHGVDTEVKSAAATAAPDNTEETPLSAKTRRLIEKFEAERALLPVREKLELPAPKPGTVVYYGTDGQLNRIVDTNNPDASVYAMLPKGTRKPAGTYTFGTYNVITIVNSTADRHVYGTGRFTVYGELEQDQIGDHDNKLYTGCCATKGEIDNPFDGTLIYCTANNITKTLCKEDVGTLPNAIIDIWKWSPNDRYFGEYYNEHLSFDNASYWYEF